MGTVELKWCDKCGKINTPLTTYIQMTDFQSRTTDWDRKKNARLLCQPCLQEAVKSYEELKKYDRHPLDGI
tara:strand:- start:1056 stop:1268 length:213 start_codon:yes stop_codon:yes gene_type:complete